MYLDFLFDVFRECAQAEAIVWRGQIFTYRTLAERVEDGLRQVDALGLGKGSVVAVEADFSVNSIALLLALIERACVVVPLSRSVAARKQEFLELAQVEGLFELDDEDQPRFTATGTHATHELLGKLRTLGNPGLVLFSSGSTGKSKAAVHDLTRLLPKFKVRRQSWRAVSFLLYDHIGGINSLLYQLSNGGCTVTVADRRPDAVLAAVEKHRVELLPTSPTFINLVLLSEAYRRHDLGSLRLVTYGTEPMPESTLSRFHQLFPQIQLQQTYGLSEVGILRSKSRSPDSLWVRLGGEGVQTRVVDGLLEIKSESAMLGYLNAPSPFTIDGWFMTRDAVETDGEWFRILGRQSELINVGGEKVYPAQVESVLLGMEGVEDVSVNGEPSAIMGAMVVAHVKLSVAEPASSFRRRMWDYCQPRLPRHQIPQRVIICDHGFAGARFKKMRATAHSSA